VLKTLMAEIDRQAGLRRGAVGSRSQHEKACAAFRGKAANMLRPADAER